MIETVGFVWLWLMGLICWLELGHQVKRDRDMFTCYAFVWFIAVPVLVGMSFYDRHMNRVRTAGDGGSKV